MKIILIFFFLSLPLLAGDKVGNGGDVLLCEGRAPMLLDVFQGENSWDLIPLPRAGAREEILRDVLRPLMRVDSVIGKKILSRALELEWELGLLEKGQSSSLVRLTSRELVNIADEGAAEVPRGCRIAQAAVQVQLPLPREAKFTFQKDIWDALGTEGQASLILHETVFEHFLASNELASRSTRFFTASLIAGALDSVSKYLSVALLFGFKTLSLEVSPSDRVFGEKGLCRIRRQKKGMGNGRIGESTTIIVRGRSVVSEEDFNHAMNIFVSKYSSQGACD